MKYSVFIKNSIKFILILFCFSPYCKADVYEEYIDTYSPMALEEMEEYNIPASIILAQGLLESSAGRSRLATQGNNHFGIKCHNEWKGKSMLRDDDAPNECFRVYDNPKESYRDHSIFLKRNRYASLFDLNPDDYQGWARGLSRCGYATDPNYADKLVAVIERYALYNYDSMQGNLMNETLAFIRETLSSTHPIRKSQGLHYVVAFPGDTYKSIAKEFGLKEKTLKDYNDSKKGDIKEWEEVYLEPKKDHASSEVKTATIGEGENMRSISQRYGIKLSALKALNKNVKDRPGSLLKLP